MNKKDKGGTPLPVPDNAAEYVPAIEKLSDGQKRMLKVNVYMGNSEKSHDETTDYREHFTGTENYIVVSDYPTEYITDNPEIHSDETPDNHKRLTEADKYSGKEQFIEAENYIGESDQHSEDIPDNSDSTYEHAKTAEHPKESKPAPNDKAKSDNRTEEYAPAIEKLSDSQKRLLKASIYIGSTEKSYDETPDNRNLFTESERFIGESDYPSEDFPDNSETADELTKPGEKSKENTADKIKSESSVPDYIPAIEKLSDEQRHILKANIYVKNNENAKKKFSDNVESYEPEQRQEQEYTEIYIGDSNYYSEELSENPYASDNSAQEESQPKENISSAEIKSESHIPDYIPAMEKLSDEQKHFLKAEIFTRNNENAKRKFSKSAESYNPEYQQELTETDRYAADSVDYSDENIQPENIPYSTEPVRENVQSNTADDYSEQSENADNQGIYDVLPEERQPAHRSRRQQTVSPDTEDNKTISQNKETFTQHYLSGIGAAKAVSSSKQTAENIESSESTETAVYNLAQSGILSFGNRIADEIIHGDRKNVPDRHYTEQKKYRFLDEKTVENNSERSARYKMNFAEKQAQKQTEHRRELIREEQKAVYIRANKKNPDFIGRKIEQEKYRKRKKKALLALSSSGLILPLLCVVCVIGIIGAAFSWITTFTKSVWDGSDYSEVEYTPEELAEMIKGYVDFAEDYIDRAQIEILKKCDDEMWSIFNGEMTSDNHPDWWEYREYDKTERTVVVSGSSTNVTADTEHISEKFEHNSYGNKEIRLGDNGLETVLAAAEVLKLRELTEMGDIPVDYDYSITNEDIEKVLADLYISYYEKHILTEAVDTDHTSVYYNGELVSENTSQTVFHYYELHGQVTNIYDIGGETWLFAHFHFNEGEQALYHAYVDYIMEIAEGVEMTYTYDEDRIKKKAEALAEEGDDE